MVRKRRVRGGGKGQGGCNEQGRREEVGKE